MKKWLAAYDIRDSKRLVKIAKLFESCGVRVQKSIFELDCPDETLNSLRARTRDILKDEDYALFFPLCEKDWQKREFYGIDAEKRTIADGDYVVL